MDINMTLLGQTIAMVVFVWFTMRFIWPPVMNAIEERQTKIADGLAAAERGQQSLDNAKEEAAAIVNDARKQASGILDQAHARAGQSGCRTAAPRPRWRGRRRGSAVRDRARSA